MVHHRGRYIDGAVQGASEREGCWDGRQSVGAEEGQMGREQHQTVTSEGALEAALQAASHSAPGLANHRGQYRGQYRGPHVRGL